MQPDAQRHTEVLFAVLLSIYCIHTLASVKFCSLALTAEWICFPHIFLKLRRHKMQFVIKKPQNAASSILKAFPVVENRNGNYCIQV